MTPRPIVRSTPRRALERLLAAGIDPLLARLYAARGIEHPAETDTALARLLPPEAMKGTREAAELLAEAIDAQARIVVIGDYDCDGATATAVAVRALRAMGAHVDFLVPNRFTYGYGLSPEIVALAAERFAPDVLITVDNGIASVEGAAAARALGMSLVITDHHLPGDVLPEADAIVNPNQPGCDFPSKSMAGVGVMFYVLLALRAELRQRGAFDGPEPAPGRPKLASAPSGGSEPHAVGSVGALFPTGNVVDTLEVPGVGSFAATLINAGIPTIFLNAQELGYTGTELQGAINGDAAALARFEAIRAHGALRMGLIQQLSEAATRQHTPKIAFVAPPASYIASSGKAIDAKDIDLLVRALSMGQLHHAMMGTAAVAIGTAAAIPGTLVNLAAGGGACNAVPGSVRFGHPSGTLRVGAEARLVNGEWQVTKALMSRSARILMEGWVRVPGDCF